MHLSQDVVSMVIPGAVLASTLWIAFDCPWPGRRP